MDRPLASRLFDPAKVKQAVRLIRADDQIVELRVLEATTTSNGWPATHSGYFDDPDKLVNALQSIRQASGFYITVNPVKPALLARSHNRLRKAAKGSSTTDTDVTSRLWLLIDTDAQRPSGISADEAEHEAALGRAREIAAFLAAQDWPPPIVADSGNGGHLMYRIDLPVDDDGLVGRCLSALADRFDDDVVKIDSTVCNPARIWKLYGTRACKGDSTAERPHRLAQVIDAPDPMQIVNLEQLNKLAGETTPNAESSRRQSTSNGSGFDIDRFIAEHGLEVSGPQEWSGSQGMGRRWTLTQSPMCDHHDGAAYILQHGSGAISAGCHHNSCSWNWAQLRHKYEPVDTTRAKTVQTKGSVVPSTAERKHQTPFIEPYQPFPVEAFPAPVSTFIKAVAAAIGCDPAYVALPTLACLARAIGNRRVIRLKNTWTEPAVIWAAIVGKSGTHKSPALKSATQILQGKQNDAFAQHKRDMEEYAVQRAKYERDYAHWKRRKGDEQPPWEPKPPTIPRYIVSDITIEALAVRLNEQDDGVLVVRDELAGWINGIGEYKGGRKSSDSGHWLATWSAAPMTVDRKTGTQTTMLIPRATVSIVGGIQPGILRTALGREHMQDGMCARLLLAMPEPRLARWNESVIPTETELALRKIYDALFSLESAADAEGRPVPFPIDLTPEAKAVWVEYYNRHRAEQVELDDDLSAAWSKLEAYTARFSLIFQLCSWAAGEAVETQIDEAAMRSAIILSDWFGAEARRVYAVLAETEEQREIRELKELIGRRGGKITVRQLQRSSRRYNTADKAEKALITLFSAGDGVWTVTRPGSQGGQPLREFQLTDSADTDTIS